MNLLLLNTSERTGGAAVAANRLMVALQKAGIGCRMLVRDKKTSNSDVLSVNCSFIAPKVNFVRFAWERFIIFLSNKLSRKNLFQVSIANTGTDISELSIVKKADILHLHWINQGFLSLNDIERLIESGKPLVWTMHDLWPATGICHYPDTCLRYQTECRDCPMQIGLPLLDLAKRTYQKKGEIDFSSVTFVGCSEWITAQARTSKLLKNARFISIPNPIDTSVFRPIDKHEARTFFNLPTDKYLLLFAAAKLSDTRKGAAYLVEACHLLKDTYKEKIEIVLMGNSSQELAETLPFKVNSLGYISDAGAMVSAYASADMFIIPSLEDNLPNTIMESMASGTPCVGFDTGGIPEMINHRLNGYVAKYKDSEDLASGIRWIIENSQKMNLSEGCVRKVHGNYTEAIISQKYIALYSSLLKP